MVLRHCAQHKTIGNKTTVKSQELEKYENNVACNVSAKTQEEKAK